jgi:N-methylhydantoinase B
MAYKLMRMSYSSIIRESEDFGCALIDPRGRQISESRLSTPLQSGPIGGYVRGILRALGEMDESIAPGDVIMHNHPYYGASHGPDVAFCVPIFIGDDLQGLSVTTAHHLDIGAATPGSCGIVDVQDAFAEGLQLKAIKVYEQGRRNDWVWRMLRDNIRMSHIVCGDMEAQISAATLGAQRFIELADKYGLEVLQAGIEDSLDYAERRIRDKILSLPDGSYRSEGFVDGFVDIEDDRYRRLKVAVELRITGSDILVDLTGTAPQVDRPINMPFEGTVDVACYVVVRSVLLDSDLEDPVPANAGLYRPVTVTAPLGCLANPVYPAPVIARFCPGNVLAAAVMSALGQVAPDRVSAGVGNLKVVAYSGVSEARGNWVYMDITEGSYGGRRGKDGMDAVDTLYANTRNNPIEDIESHYPLRVERYELNEDAAGAGQWRGGVGSVRDVRFLEDGGFSVEGDGDLVAPIGAFGGLPGTPGATILNPGGPQEQRLGSMSPYRRVTAGSVLRTVSPCGGGYGPPEARPQGTVLEDHLDDLISGESAKRLYGLEVESRERDSG